MCQFGEHESCGHKFGSSMSLFGRNRQEMALLCNCSCHASCPMGPAGEVASDEWTTRCTCSGSDDLRDIEAQVRADSEVRKAMDAEVLRDVKIEPGQSAEDIQQQILAAYQAHGYEPPSDFSRWSRLIAAGTARRGTRTVRLLIETVSGLRAARRWWVDQRDDSADDDSAR